jgi:hypothetical protein
MQRLEAGPIPEVISVAAPLLLSQIFTYTQPCMVQPQFALARPTAAEVGETVRRVGRGDARYAYPHASSAYNCSPLLIRIYRCNEGRPSCGLCRKNNKACHYDALTL